VSTFLVQRLRHLHSWPNVGLAIAGQRSIVQRMTARDEILDVARDLATRSADRTFTVQQVVSEMFRRGSTYRESTIRTHVVSRMCTNAPNHHAVVFDDFVRLEHGCYVLASDQR